jgi:hypothetical protein
MPREIRCTVRDLSRPRLGKFAWGISRLLRYSRERRGDAHSGGPAQAAAHNDRRHFMKAFETDQTDLNRCVKEAASSSVLIVKNGKPMALVSNVQGLDAEQIELGCSDGFWSLIEERRRQKTIPWEEVKKRLRRRVEEAPT